MRAIDYCKRNNIVFKELKKLYPKVQPFSTIEKFLELQEVTVADTTAILPELKQGAEKVVDPRSWKHLTKGIRAILATPDLPSDKIVDIHNFMGENSYVLNEWNHKVKL